MGTVTDECYTKIKTFVFFDLETTDLIKGNKFPNITEFAVVATSRDSINVNKTNKLALPRILHKLVIPVRPKVSISHPASLISGLWNDTLEHAHAFDDKTCDMILCFLDRLPPPICFVAHNGNRFDYPIFLEEIKELRKVLPDSILCVDSLKAFQEYFANLPEETVASEVFEQGVDEVDEDLENNIKEVKDTSFEDNWNDALYKILDDFNTVKVNKNDEVVGKDELDTVKDFKTNSMTNPQKSPTDLINPFSMQAINEKTPENNKIKNTNQLRNSAICSKDKSSYDGAIKRIKFEKNNKPANFKLQTIYMHLLGTDAENQHNAEGDCITMLRCVCQLGPYFPEWADNNAVSMNLFKANTK